MYGSAKMNVDGDRFDIPYTSLQAAKLEQFSDEHLFIREYAFERKLHREIPETIGVPRRKLLILYADEFEKYEPKQVRVEYTW